MAKETGQYDMRITASNIKDLKPKKGETLKFSYHVSPKTAEILRIKQTGKFEAVISEATTNEKFDTVKDLKVFVLKIGVIMKGFVALTSGKGWLYGNGKPKEHQH